MLFLLLVNFLFLFFARACFFSCVRLFLFFSYFSLVFISFVVLYRRVASGSGARGLIKAPGGGAGGAPPAYVSLRVPSFMDGFVFPPCLSRGDCGGCPPVTLLDIYRWTDTNLGLVSFCYV